MRVKEESQHKERQIAIICPAPFPNQGVCHSCSAEDIQFYEKNLCKHGVASSPEKQENVDYV